MELYEKTLEQVSKYEGRVIHVHVDTVELPNGRTSTREIVNHPGGVGILALDENNNVLVVRQYRYAFGRTLIEIPAGKLEKGEDPYQAAMRELMKDKTCFVIAHRLSTIQNADNILVVRDGDIVEQGSHQQLMERGGFYASLYNSQFQ